MKHLYLCFGLLLAQCVPLCAQDTIVKLPDRYIKQVGAKAERTSKLIDCKTRKAFLTYQKQEHRLMEQINKLNPEVAQNLFAGPMQRIDVLKEKLAAKRRNLVPTVFNGYLDTLQGSLKFLARDGIQSNSSLTRATQSVTALQDRLALADELNEVMQQRRRELAEQLAQYVDLAGALKEFKKSTYYYNKRLQEYKVMLADSKMAERKALELLQQSSVFQKFMTQHSIFAQLFGSMATGTDLTVLESLQTRGRVERLLNIYLGTSVEGRQLISARMDVACSRFDEYKKKFNDLGTAADIPDFKPNEMKVKRFLKRLEPGGNIQFQRSSYYFPVTADIAAQLGYRFHKSGTAGIGFTYKLGTGRSWDHIVLSHQGIGFRTYLDWKLKGLLFISGGYEGSHLSAFKNIAALKNWDGWRFSGLIGLTRKVKVRGNKKVTTSILYDFLSPKHALWGDKIKTRIGYSF